MSLRLWVEAEGSDDMDLFVCVQKFDAAGQYVPFVYYAILVNGPVALGWLRVSHRELDPARSRPERPFHPHTREQRLKAGERVPADIEIWASSTSFKAGERLRVIVQGRDIEHETLPNSPYMGHEETRNQGTHVIHAGGEYDSYLLVPVIPKK
jgi:predicted acyl esterase